MKKPMIFFLLSFSFFASAEECQKARVRYIFDRKYVYEAVELCREKSPDNVIFYFSSSCVKRQCEILKREKKEIKVKARYSNTGSPGFKLCQELAGVPQIFEFQLKDSPNQTWQSSERCLFGEKDFVEISLLTREWKPFIK